MAKTIFEHRLIAALVLCMSGLALLPFNPLPSQVFGWEVLAGAYQTIFRDGFESGTSEHWEPFAPENLRIFPTSDQATFRQDYRIDRELVSRFSDSGVVLMAGFSRAGDPVFSVEARSTQLGLEVRSGAALDGGDWRETDWHMLEQDSRLGIEWQQGHPLAQDGFLYLSVDGQLTAWLTDLDNDTLLLDMTAITKSGARTLLIPYSSAQ